MAGKHAGRNVRRLTPCGLSRRAAAIVVCLALLNCSGCATRYLWIDSDVAGYRDPMPASRLALFDAQDRQDVLAIYDECASPHGERKRRAYFVLENRKRTEAERKPRFVSLSLSNGLAAIPISSSAVQPSPARDLHAIQTENLYRFTLISQNGESLGEFVLPTYRSRFGTVKCVALTPITLAVDATVIGTILAAAVGWAYAVAYSPAAGLPDAQKAR